MYTALGALVAVVDDINRLALTDRHLQCRQHELGAQMRLDRPADDPTAERIEHDSEIQEASHRRDIRDVGDPELGNSGPLGQAPGARRDPARW